MKHKLFTVPKTFQFTSVDIGIQETIEWFIKNYETIRK